MSRVKLGTHTQRAQRLQPFFLEHLYEGQKEQDNVLVPQGHTVKDLNLACTFIDLRTKAHKRVRDGSLAQTTHSRHKAGAQRKDQGHSTLGEKERKCARLIV